MAAHTFCRSLVCLLKTTQQLVATLYGCVKRGLGVFVASPYGLKLFVNDATNLVEGPKTQPF